MIGVALVVPFVSSHVSKKVLYGDERILMSIAANGIRLSLDVEVCLVLW